jgi:hypothetical protein
VGDTILPAGPFRWQMFLFATVGWIRPDFARPTPLGLLTTRSAISRIRESHGKFDGFSCRANSSGLIFCLLAVGELAFGLRKRLMWRAGAGFTRQWEGCEGCAVLRRKSHRADGSARAARVGANPFSYRNYCRGTTIQSGSLFVDNLAQVSTLRS